MCHPSVSWAAEFILVCRLQCFKFVFEFYLEVISGQVQKCFLSLLCFMWASKREYFLSFLALLIRNVTCCSCSPRCNPWFLAPFLGTDSMGFLGSGLRKCTVPGKLVSWQVLAHVSLLSKENKGQKIRAAKAWPCVEGPLVNDSNWDECHSQSILVALEKKMWGSGVTRTQSYLQGWRKV